MNNIIYLDCAASTPINPRVKEDIIYSLNEDFWNPSSIYKQGREVKRKIEYARQQVKDLIGARDNNEIIFCSCGSEANNLAIKGFMEGNENTILITDMVSHPSIFNISSERYFENADCIYCNVNKYGQLDTNDLEYILWEINPNKNKDINILVATTWVNNEVGTINNIKLICDIVHEYGGYVLVDCCQGIYHLPINVEVWDVDMITFTSEKMGMPRGCSVLYKKQSAKITPQIQGGHQENDYRAGTENTMMIIPFGNQCERIKNELEDNTNKEYKLLYLIENAIKKACENICKYKINGRNYDISNNDYVRIAPNILSIQFYHINEHDGGKYNGYDNQELLTLLDQYGVMCSAGSACSAGEKTPSRVLKRIGFTDKEALSTIRFSFDHTLKEEDIENFGKILRKCLMVLKQNEN